MTIAEKKTTTPTVAAFPLDDDDAASQASNLYPTATNVPTMTSPYGITPTPLPMNIEPLTVPMYEQEKLGAKCCGCCCDFRRAVIIVNGIIIGLSAYSLLSLFSPTGSSEDSTTQYQDYEGMTIDDDGVIEELEDIYHQGFLANAILGGILLVLTCVPLYGAYSFRVPLIGFGIVLLVVSYITRVVVAYLLIDSADGVSDEYTFSQPYVFYVFSGIVASFFIYPHVALIMEIRQGIMSLETYPREEFSCCCTGSGSGGRRRPPTVVAPAAVTAQQHPATTTASASATTTTTGHGDVYNMASGGVERPTPTVTAYPAN